MPWLLSAPYIDVMVQEARLRDKQVSAWWRDERALDVWWDMHGLPLDALSYGSKGGVVGCVPDASFAALVRRVAGPATGSAATWLLLALVPRDEMPGLSVLQSTLWGEKGTKWPSHWITKYRTPGLAELQLEPVAVGDWIACRAAGDHSGLFGKCVSLNEKGRPAEVQTDMHGTVLVCDQVAQKWFKLVQREEACAWFFTQGRTQFVHYINMLQQLARKQKSLVGKDYKSAPPRKGQHPGKLARIAAQRVLTAEGLKLRESLIRAHGGMVTAGMDLDAATAWLDAELAKHGLPKIWPPRENST